jgi:hypothetical protein
MAKLIAIILILSALEISVMTYPMFGTFEITGLNPKLAIPKPDVSLVMKCLSLGDMMPAFNPSSGQFDCHTLATRGPCGGETFLFTI